jgi:hypothetical protein
MPACTEPGCTGAIVDGYCDICGSPPASATPFVQAGAAIAAAPPAIATRPRRLAVRQELVAAAVLLLLGCAVLLSQVAPDFRSSRPSTTVHSAPTMVVAQSASPGGESLSANEVPVAAPVNGSAEGATIQVDLPKPAKVFDTVRIEGTYRGGPDTFLRIQRWEEGGWVAFPVPTKTNQSGQFTAYVEFGRPGRYMLRVFHPGSGVTSEPFAVVISGSGPVP